MTWSTAGQSARLLSLEGTWETYTGGAHPAHGSRTLLWDRSLNRAIEVTALFAKSSSFPALTRATYCKALDAERAVVTRLGGGCQMPIGAYATVEGETMTLAAVVMSAVAVVAAPSPAVRASRVDPVTALRAQ